MDIKEINVVFADGATTRCIYPVDSRTIVADTVQEYPTSQKSHLTAEDAKRLEQILTALHLKIGGVHDRLLQHYSEAWKDCTTRLQSGASLICELHLLVKELTR